MTRRLFVLLATPVLCLIVTAVLAASPQPSFNDYLILAERARSVGNMAGMEQALTQAHRYGPGTEYSWRSLAWAQAHQGKWRESLSSATENIRRNGVCGWSLEQLTESALCAGDLKLAEETLQQAARLPESHIGTARRALTRVTERFRYLTGTRTYQLQWLIPATPFGKDHLTFQLLMPKLETDRQHVAYTVSNVASWKPLADGNRDLVEVTQKVHEPCYINATASISAFVVGRERLDKMRNGQYSQLAQGALGAFIHDRPYYPDIPLCKDLASRLKGATDARTVQNILDWMSANVKYDATRLPQGGLEGTLVYRKGVCHAWSSAFTALCRAAGVPAVVAHGINLPGDHVFKDRKGSHGWSEVYLCGIGWVPVDPLHRDSLALFGGKQYLTTDLANFTPTDDHFAYHSIQGFRFSGRIVSDTSDLPLTCSSSGFGAGAQRRWGEWADTSRPRDPQKEAFRHLRRSPQGF